MSYEGSGNVVAVDLVASQIQGTRAACDVLSVAGSCPVSSSQGVFALAVQQPTRAVQEVQRRSLRLQEEARQRQVAVGNPRRSTEQPQPAQTLPGDAVPFEQLDVVGKQSLNRKRIAVGHSLYQVDKEARAEL
jgi:hypothetical protein